MARDQYLQAVRGVAITVVVLIHCLPQCMFAIILRPFLNWGVAAFLFLSGFLTSEAKVVAGGVLARRAKRTLPSYVVWSVFYAVLLQRVGVLGTLKLVLTAGASAQMYFIAVYLQLVVLTPLLYWLLHRCRWLVYAISPISLVAYEVVTAMQFCFPVLGRLFPFWLIFYVIGLDWDRWKCAAARCRRFVAPCVLVTIGCQVVAGFCWNALGNYNMATTQLKLSSMASSLAVIVAIKTVSSGMKLSLADSPFAKLGDASFGIYLCHILVLAILQKLLGSLFLPLWVGTVVLWMATLLFSDIVVTAASRLLPKRVTDLIGFS